MKKKFIVSTVLGLALLAFALIYALEPEAEPVRFHLPGKVTVKVAKVSKASTGREVRFSAIISPEHHAELSFTMPARMMKRLVEVGDRVEPGQVLASLDVREFDNALAAARSAVTELEVNSEQAKREHHRYARLKDTKAVSSQQAEQAAARYHRLRAALSGARARLAEAERKRDEAELRAPFAGIVTSVHLEAGEWAMPGHPVIKLVNDQSLELRVEVPETVIGHLKPGQQVNVNLPFLQNTRASGRISHMARASSSAGRLFPVVVKLDPDPRVFAGMTAELLARLESQNTVLVPVAAVINPGGSRPSLYVLKGDRVREVFIELGSLNGDKVAVMGNISPQDKVVVQGQTLLSDGKLVEIRS